MDRETPNPPDPVPSASVGASGGLRQRLDRLRQARQPQAAAPMQEAAEGSSLAERLARLRPGSVRSPGRRGDEKALADCLAAEVLAPGLLRLRESHPMPADPSALAVEQLADLADLAAEPPATWCFFDTETSGLAGGVGTWVFLFGCARPRDDYLEVEQYLLTRLDAEALLLEQVAGVLAQSRLLISYNGKSFDAPLLATRARLVAAPAIAARLDALAHLDLLHPVRRAFARRWTDCRLTTAETELLRRPRENDLPGAEAPAAWLDWLRHGEIDRLLGVVAHNRQDLLSLAALVPALAMTHRAPHQVGADCAAVASGWIHRGQPERARQVLRSALDAKACDNDCRWLLSLLSRRCGDWSAAVRLWEELADHEDARALEALAKFYEHRRCDPMRALDYADRLPPGAASEHRRRRLRARLCLIGAVAS